MRTEQWVIAVVIGYLELRVGFGSGPKQGWSGFLFWKFSRKGASYFKSQGIVNIRMSDDAVYYRYLEVL